MAYSDVIAQLEAEWARDLDSPTAEHQFDALRALEPALSEVESLRRLVTVMAARDAAQDLDRHDEVLLALLRQAPASTPLGEFAARTTLALLLPGVRGRCGRLRLAHLEPAERLDALLAAVFEEIRAPRSPWKTKRVGAQVIGRAYHRLRPRRGAAARYRTVPYADVDQAIAGRSPYEPEPKAAGIELLELLAEAVCDGRLAREKARLIAAVRVAGTDLKSMAAELGVSYDTVIHRLRRAEAELCRKMPRAA